MYRQRPLGPDDLICPLHKEPMSNVCHKCPLWISVRGMHPQTDKEVDEWGCSFAFMPMLAINAAKETKHTTASVDKLTNLIAAKANPNRNANRVPIVQDDPHIIITNAVSPKQITSEALTAKQLSTSK